MIAKLERILSTAQQNKDQTQNPQTSNVIISVECIFQGITTKVNLPGQQLHKGQQLYWEYLWKS